MMTWSINLFVLATGFFIVGMFNPQWIFFWMKKPGRLSVALFSLFLFMVGATMFGQANMDKRKAMEKQTQQSVETKADETPTVKIEAVKENLETVKETP